MKSSCRSALVAKNGFILIEAGLETRFLIQIVSSESLKVAFVAHLGLVLTGPRCGSVKMNPFAIRAEQPLRPIRSTRRAGNRRSVVQRQRFASITYKYSALQSQFGAKRGEVGQALGNFP